MFHVMLKGKAHRTRLVPGDALLIECNADNCSMSRVARGQLPFGRGGPKTMQRDIVFKFGLAQAGLELVEVFATQHLFDLSQGGELTWVELHEFIGLRELRGRRKFEAHAKEAS